ncbi:hypothetical protein HU200_039931 [Digitaria exilis]|uniref:Protein kinase domain-containing protein n=1 Tax=Digitaria exilis TaxID=1010633 RepID=A0A835B6V9_9POAL|nr:hypothetical protein HU200_039931 [Digitaria exilis]
MAEIHKRLLCFEYLSNGNLYEYLSDASCGLEWRKRYQIIQGICEGLKYLHGNDVVHLALQPCNILLDDNMVPKIAEFCLSVSFDDYLIIIYMTLLCRAYMTPEIVLSERITFKSDIYSLGVIITDILIGHTHHNFEIQNVRTIYNYVSLLR